MKTCQILTITIFLFFTGIITSFSHEQNKKQDLKTENTNKTHKTVENYNCNELLTPVYNTYSVTNDSEYLKRLIDIYSYEKEQYNSTKSSSGLSVILPEYGSGEYKQNKKNVEILKKKYSKIQDYTLTSKEHIDLSYNIIDPSVRIAQFDSFIKCVELNSGMPSLNVTFNNENEVHLALTFPTHKYTLGRESKVRKILYSKNIIPDENDSLFIKGAPIKFGQSYSLRFSRKDINSGYVSIDLENEDIISVPVPQFIKDRRFEDRWESGDENGNPYALLVDVALNSNVKIITISYPNMELPTENPRIISNPQNVEIKTNLSSRDCRITHINPTTIQGSTRGAPVNNWTLSENNIKIISTVFLNRHLTRLRYYIYYQKKRSVCVENCN